MSIFEQSPWANLKPESFWRHFYALTQIPRPSKDEGKAADYLIDFAKKNNLEWKKDAVGNVLISKKGSSGYENSQIVILQSHMDMVCEKNNDVDFDFATQPLKIAVKGDFVCAEGTSLGADNGAGMAASLAVLEDASAVHPPLECLFTMDEETGMTGAKGMEKGLIKGRQLLNLDSEAEGDIYIGCAGGIDNYLVYTPEFETPSLPNTAKVVVKGLKGGHSGLEIIQGRANAIKLLARFLLNAKDEGIKWSLASFEGGNKRNAIPREAQAVIFFEDKSALDKSAEKWKSIFTSEFKDIENSVEIVIEPYDNKFEKVLTQKTSNILLSAICVLHHGVVRMDHHLEDLVESSSNLAIVKFDGTKFNFEISHRSSTESVKMAISRKTQALAEIIGFEYSKGEGYPGWQPNMESRLLRVAKEEYKKLYNKEINVKAIHAGLECGLIMEQYPGLDAVSFGPNLAGVHSPDETMQISSVPNFYNFLLAYLKGLK